MSVQVYEGDGVKPKKKSSFQPCRLCHQAFEGDSNCWIFLGPDEENGWGLTDDKRQASIFSNKKDFDRFYQFLVQHIKESSPDNGIEAIRAVPV